jgi:23S rRNA pseudouridine955/2504/2580 synthase
MRELTVTSREEGQRLDKYLKKYLSASPASFIYKMLRKKNIKLNGKKASGSEIISSGDRISVYLSDDTIRSFQKEETGGPETGSLVPGFLYEDEDIAVLDKPPGLLTQSAGKGGSSLADLYPSMLIERGALTEEDLRAFRPSPMNRLDRNTSGIVLCSKSMRGARTLADLIRQRELKKEYLAVSEGIPPEGLIRVFGKKDPSSNLVKTASEPFPGSYEMLTRVRVLHTRQPLSLLGVELITGRTHQIRSSLSFLSCPIVGDLKYGDRSGLSEIVSRFGIRRQMLHAASVTFPDDCGECPQLRGLHVEAPVPEDMVKIVNWISNT